MTAQFKIGSTYEMSFIGDRNLRPQYKCVKRTAKTATFIGVKNNEVLNRRVKTYDNREYVLDGAYSMAPAIYADKVV
jgi:hypothetical protein